MNDRPRIHYRDLIVIADEKPIVKLDENTGIVAIRVTIGGFLFSAQFDSLSPGIYAWSLEDPKQARELFDRITGAIDSTDQKDS